jgi:hypothetical protein
MTDPLTSTASTGGTDQSPANPGKGPKRETRVVTEGVLKRYLGGPGQFALAIGACFALVFGIYLITPSEEHRPHPRTIDYTWSAKEFARKAPYETFAPSGLPASWAATSSRVTGPQGKERIVSWHLVLVTPEQRTAAVEQSNENPDGAKGFVARMTNVPKSLPANAEGLQTIEGAAWEQYHQRDKRQYSLVRRLPDSTIVLTGTAGYAELAVLAASLTPQPKAG